MAIAPMRTGFTRFSGETGRVSGIVLEGANGTSYYFWYDNTGVLRTGDATVVEPAAFDPQTDGTVIGGGAASVAGGGAAVPNLAGAVGTANDTMTAIAAPTDAPATPDALRDDIATVMVPALNNNFADLQTKVNAILAALRTSGLINT